MKLVDCHAHLEDRKFEEDLGIVLDRAKKAGLLAIISNGTSKETNVKTLELAEKYSIIKPALGLHPTKIDEFKEEIEKETKLIEKNRDKTIAVGEIGLDHYWRKDNKKEQKELFERMLFLAEKIRKPVIVHSRNAQNDVLDILEDFDLRVVLHSFEGSKEQISKSIKKNYFFSIPSNIIRNKRLQLLVKEAPLDQLLTETDCPYLSPFKEKRNEPAFVVESLREIAGIKRIRLEQASEAILKSFSSIFKI